MTRLEHAGAGSFLAVQPTAPRKGGSVSDLIEGSFFGHNARSLRDACRLIAGRMFVPGTRVGLALSGALTPAGLGPSVLVPLVENGWVDWIVSTGANLYHDIQPLLGYPMREGSAVADDERLRGEGIIRIHNIVFDQQALFDADAFVRKSILARLDELAGRRLSSARLNRLLGEELLRAHPDAAKQSVLAAAAAADVPVFTPAVSDSSIGMNVAALALHGRDVFIDTSIDVNETAAIARSARREGLKSAVLIAGGGVAKNFMLQTEPHLHEVLALPEQGHDYFVQFTDARVDTGGLSGATPSEAVTWGKIEPQGLPDAVVCYGDTTVYLPLVVAYAIDRAEPRVPSRLFPRLGALVDELRAEAEAARSGGESAGP